MFKCLFIDNKGFSKFIELHDIYPKYRIPVVLPLEPFWKVSEELPDHNNTSISYVEFRYYNLDENGLYIYREI